MTSSIWLFLDLRVVLFFPFLLLKCVFETFRSLLGFGDVPQLYYCRSRQPIWLDSVKFHCKGLQKPFVPNWWVADGNLQSILAAVRSWNCRYRQEYMDMKDGGRVALDWMADDNDLEDNVPVMVVLHGFSGNSADVWPMVSEAHARGMRCVAVNKRGHESGCILATPKLLSFTDTSDLRQVIVSLHHRYPRAPFVGVGFSAGSALLCKYVTEYGDESYISAAVHISPGYDTRKLFFESGVPWPYDALLLQGQKNLLERHRKKLQDLINVDGALQSQTMNEFVEKVYSPLYGYSSAAEYWEKNNPMERLYEASVPMMCVNAADDPVIPLRMIDYSKFEQFSSLLLVVTKGGGHCGFLEGRKQKHWACELACDFIQGVLCSQSHPH